MWLLPITLFCKIVSECWNGRWREWIKRALHDQQAKRVGMYKKIVKYRLVTKGMRKKSALQKLIWTWVQATLLKRENVMTCVWTPELLPISRSSVLQKGGTLNRYPDIPKRRYIKLVMTFWQGDESDDHGDVKPRIWNGSSWVEMGTTVWCENCTLCACSRAQT